MAVIDFLASRISRPAGRVLDAPIRELVQEVLKEAGYASPAEVQAIKDEARDLKGRLDATDRKLGELVKMVEAARAEASQHKANADRLQLELGHAFEAARSAEARVEIDLSAAETRIRELLASLNVRLDTLEAKAQGTAAVDLGAQLAALDARLATPSADFGPMLAALEERLSSEPAALAARVATLESRVGVAPIPKVTVTENKGNCKVEGCENAVRARGFCSSHYQQWRRGVLTGYVTQEGTVQLGGQTVQVDQRFAGLSYTETEGGAAILIDGERVAVS